MICHTKFLMHFSDDYWGSGGSSHRTAEIPLEENQLGVISNYNVHHPHIDITCELLMNMAECAGQKYLCIRAMPLGSQASFRDTLSNYNTQCQAIPGNRKKCNPCEYRNYYYLSDVREIVGNMHKTTLLYFDLV